MIIVTGATGALNGATVDHLLTTTPASEIVVVARDTAKAQRFADLGIDVRQGDYEDAASLPAAFAGGDQILLVSSSDPQADHAALHKTAIHAAVAAGASRILYTSHQGAAADTPFGPGRSHFETEQILADSGVAWTSLRNGFYAHSLNWLLGPWRETGVIRVPLDGPVSWTSRDDAAEAAAVIVAAGGEYDGLTTLTADATPTFAEIAGIASEVAGREIGFEVQGEEAWLAAQAAAGNEMAARFMLGMYQAAAGGFFAGHTPLLGELLGREPQSVRDLLAAPAPAGH